MAALVGLLHALPALLPGPTPSSAVPTPHTLDQSARAHLTHTPRTPLQPVAASPRHVLFGTALAVPLFLPHAAAAAVVCVGGFCAEPRLPPLPTALPSVSSPSLPSAPALSPSAPPFALPLPSAFSLPWSGEKPTEEDAAAAAAAAARAKEAAARKELVKKVRAERMAAEARLQSEEYVRMRKLSSEMGFGSTVSVPTDE